MCHWWLRIKPTDKARQGAYRGRQKNRTVYPHCMVSGNRSKGSISSIWLTVPQRSRVSDCSKLQLKGSFILLHKCSRHTGWCLWWHVMHWAGLGCVSECVCCWRAAGFSSSSHYLFFFTKQPMCQIHKMKGNNYALTANCMRVPQPLSSARMPPQRICLMDFLAAVRQYQMSWWKSKPQRFPSFCSKMLMWF